MHLNIDSFAEKIMRRARLAFSVGRDSSHSSSESTHTCRLILKSTDLNGEKCYILNRQLESFEQSVSISYPTAMMLAQALNEFCETIEDYTDVADVGNITEKDVRNLVILNQHHKMEMTKLLGENSQSEFGGESINFDNI